MSVRRRLSCKLYFEVFHQRRRTVSRQHRRWPNVDSLSVTFVGRRWARSTTCGFTRRRSIAACSSSTARSATKACARSATCVDTLPTDTTGRKSSDVQSVATSLATNATWSIMSCPIMGNHHWMSRDSCVVAVIVNSFPTSRYCRDCTVTRTSIVVFIFRRSWTHL